MVDAETPRRAAACSMVTGAVVTTVVSAVAAWWLPRYGVEASRREHQAGGIGRI
jgi:hypothetical protein